MWEKDWSELCSFTVCLVTESYALGESKYRYSLLHIVLSLRKTGTAWEQGSLGETITISLQTHSMNSFHGIIDILHKSITEEKIITGNLEKQKQQQQKGNREDKKKPHKHKNQSKPPRVSSQPLLMRTELSPRQVVRCFSWNVYTEGRKKDSAYALKSHLHRKRFLFFTFLFPLLVVEK